MANAEFLDMLHIPYFQNALSTLLNLLFPSACPVCGKRSDSSLYNPICIGCWRGIKRYSGPACAICGIPTISPRTKVCEPCLKAPPPFSRVIYYGIYEGVLRKSIHLLKFGGIRRLSKPLSLLFQDLSIPRGDVLIPVPLHKDRLVERDFNQTAAIARHLSKRLDIPLRLDVLRKTRKTPAQTEVTGKERRRNIKNAYAVAGEVRDLSLLLLDDIITTGATAAECAKTLIDAGAREVVVVALARSMPRQ